MVARPFGAIVVMTVPGNDLPINFDTLAAMQAWVRANRDIEIGTVVSVTERSGGATTFEKDTQA